MLRVKQNREPVNNRNQGGTADLCFVPMYGDGAFFILLEVLNVSGTIRNPLMYYDKRRKRK